MSAQFEPSIWMPGKKAPPKRDSISTTLAGSDGLFEVLGGAEATLLALILMASPVAGWTMRAGRLRQDAQATHADAGALQRCLVMVPTIPKQGHGLLLGNVVALRQSHRQMTKRDGFGLGGRLGRCCHRLAGWIFRMFCPLLRLPLNVFGKTY